MAKLIWMSDTHFQVAGDVLGEDPRARLNAAIDLVLAHHTDAAYCVITGDLVNAAKAENYAALAKALNRLPMPVLPLVGNHDDRVLLRQHLDVPDGMSDFIQYVVSLDGARLICLDSLIPGETAGELCEARRTWLRDMLASEPNIPTYIFMHHPPGHLGLPAQDPDNLRMPEILLTELRETGCVVKILAGHVHRPCHAILGGLPVSTIRSVTLQAPPPWPHWDWDSFSPAKERPQFGILEITGSEMRLQMLDVPNKKPGPCSPGFVVMK